MSAACAATGVLMLQQMTRRIPWTMQGTSTFSPAGAPSVEAVGALTPLQRSCRSWTSSPPVSTLQMVGACNKGLHYIADADASACAAQLYARQ
jgi:hypothetical protein